MEQDTTNNGGIRIGKGATTNMKRERAKTKDRNAERVWLALGDIEAVCKLKADHPKWGRKKISSHLQPEGGPVCRRDVHPTVHGFLIT